VHPPPPPSNLTICSNRPYNHHLKPSNDQSAALLMLIQLSFDYEGFACRYAVVYDDSYHDSETWDPHTQLYSFPWVLEEQLGEIKCSKNRVKKSEE